MQFPSSTSSFSSKPLWLGLLAAVAITLLGCHEKTPVILTHLDAFDARIEVNLVGVSQAQARQATAIIAQDFGLLQNDLAAARGGALERVNRLLATQRPFVPPQSLMPLLRLCQTFETQSDGLFNPAIGKLTELWGFQSPSPGEHPPPGRDAIDRLAAAAPSLAQIDGQGLTLRGRAPGLMLDLSGIARAYAIDLAMQHLIDLGIRNALIQADGELRAIGDRSGQPWRIPVRRASGSGVLAILPIRGDESVVTRAAYDRNFIYKGKLYHSIIDPRSGRPADQMRAVTVVADSVAKAAAASTALFVAGSSDWRRIADRMGIRYAVLLDAAGRVQVTQAMAERIELVDTTEELSLPGMDGSRPLVWVERERP